MKLYGLLCIAFCLLSTACVKNTDYVLNDGLKPDSLIRFVSITPVESEADSFSKIIVRVAVSQYTDAKVQVTLNTEQGLINASSKSETMPVNLSRYVDFIITTGRTSGPVKIKATILDSLIRDTIIHFAKAYPDSVLVYPQQLVMNKNTNVVVDIDLFRKIGYPSIRQAILYQAMDTLGNKIGTFTNTEEFIPGQSIQATFTPMTDFTGKAILRTTVIKEDGGQLSGSAEVLIQ